MNTIINIGEFRASSGVGFGTSGIRDLETKLTDRTVFIYTQAFIGHLRKIGDLRENKIAIAGDLRYSTDRIMTAVSEAIKANGVDVINCGHIPTPAITYYGLAKKIPTIMVTGSHIPADRNGVKFQLSTKEILKKDEEQITNSTVEINDGLFDDQGMFVTKPKLVDEIDDGRETYIQRYINNFGDKMLMGKKVGVWGHSAVGRDIYFEILTRLGANVTKIEYSDGEFLPVDTDSVNEETRLKMKKWDQDMGLDFIMSTDGDGDRPLLTDERGEQIRSELLPLFASKYLGSKAVAVTLTSCSVIEKTGWFEKIVRTKVGSPHIVEAMENLEKEGYGVVTGYELNGGFFMNELKTRDALFPILASIALSHQSGVPLSEMIMNLPKRFTYASSIKGIPTEKSLQILDRWEDYKDDIENYFGKIVDINILDGLRLTFENEDVVHFRPSKNAPEFRNYTDSNSFEHAKILSLKAIELIEKWTAVNSS